MNISGPFIRNPVATTLLMVGLLAAGIVTYPLLPVAALPQVDFPTIQISAQLPGASPETMAASVAQPLERQFSQIPGVAQVTSVSQIGASSVTVQFDLDRNIDAAANDIQAAINSASGQLPKDLPSPPTYRKVNPADSPIFLLAATSDTLDLTAVNDEVDSKLAQQISQLPGVGQVIIGGQQKPAVRIQIDPEKLVAKGMSLEDIRAQITNATTNSPKGQLNTDRRSFTLYANDQILVAKEWNDIIIGYTNGAPLRVQDVGKAVAGPEDLYQLGWANGKPGLFLVIFKQPGANVVETVDRIKASLPRLTASLPPSIHVFTLSDRTQTIRAAVKDVQFTLFLSILLVVLVIFFFLRNTVATLIPSITVPLALLGACALMWASGYSLDNLSLMSLTISVGFVVDDAIVMLENISRHIEEGASPMEASLKGAGEIGFTIFSISLSLIAVLIPLFLMNGIIGRLFREFSVTLAMTIFVSFIVSVTLVPMLTSRFLKPHAEVTHGRIFNLSERFFVAMLKGYERTLDIVMRHERSTLAVFFVTVGLSVYLFMIIPKGFFPQQDNGLITGVSEAGQDVSFAQMRRYQEKLAALVQSDPDVATVGSVIGGSWNQSNSGRIFITLKPRDERTSTAQQIIARLRPQLEQISGARLYLQAAQDVRLGGRPSRTQFEFTLQDADIDALNMWAPKILDLMRSLPELKDVASDQQTSGMTVALKIDRDRASKLGLTPQMIDDTLYDAFGQRQVAQYFTQLNSYHVILEVNPEEQKSTDVLDNIYLKSNHGVQVPLSAIASWSSVPVKPLTISHQGQFPATTISFNLAPNIALGEATKAISKAMAQIGAPPTLIGTFQGTAQAFQQSLATVPMLIVAALFVVYLILGILYESFLHPLTILSTLPSAGVGALAILMTCGFDFSLIALIGIILLIGIVKKNGIMLVDFAIVAERIHHMTPHEAIRQAALLRFRPIMMTTFAALLGGLPLMLGTGTGSEIRQPLGYAMVGGLIVSQILTLYTTPVIYLYLDRARRFFHDEASVTATPVPKEIGIG
jgi:HAE1 family hydrophobic/amphiphilic exporter-1